MRILCTADLHVDDRVSLAGLCPTDRDTGEPLVLTQARRTLAWIAREAREREVDLILIAGDLYDRPRPSPAAEAVAAAWLSDLCEVAPVVLLLGNHDRGNGPEAHALEPLKHLRPGRLVVLDRPDPVGVVTGDQWGEHFADPAKTRVALDAVIYPLPYPSRSYLAASSLSPEDTAARMSVALDEIVLAHATAARLRQDATTILLGHGTLRGAAYNEYQTVPLSDLQIGCDHFEAFDLAVWGHLHKRQRAPGCTWAGEPTVEFTHGYVGSPMRQDFGEEGEPHGISVLDDASGVWRCEFVHNPTDRHFWTIRADRFVDLGLDPEALNGEDCVLRVVGETSPEQYDLIAAKVRALKGGGAIIANNCQVIRPDRARVAMARGDLGLEPVLRAACESREDLRPHADVIVARARALEGV